jgi:hypothetical protein
MHLINNLQSYQKNKKLKNTPYKINNYIHTPNNYIHTPSYKMKYFLNKTIMKNIIKTTPIIIFSIGGYLINKEYLNKTFLNFITKTKDKFYTTSKYAILYEEEVYRINPIPGKIYFVTENAHYNILENKYFSTNLHPLKYGGVYIKRITIDNITYDVFDENVQIIFTDRTCYKELNVLSLPYHCYA